MSLQHTLHGCLAFYCHIQFHVHVHIHVHVLQVLDNIEQLQNSFSDEVRDILALSDVSAGQGVEVVVTSSKWCPEVDDVPALLTGHTHLPSGPAHLVIACPIEATVKAGVKMVSE